MVFKIVETFLLIIGVKACLKPLPQQLCKHFVTDNYKICYYIEQELATL